jgi:hypothetical protein
VSGGLQLDHAALYAAMQEAAEHRGPHRAMAVTMECGHLRLLPQIATVMGPGAMTGCRMCGEDRPARVVVKVEETGVLHESYSPAGTHEGAGVPMRGNVSGGFVTERERALTETLIEARDTIVDLKGYIDALNETGVYVFGPPPMPDPAAWELYDAIMQDAEDRGEGTTVTRIGLLTFIGWRPSPASGGTS